MRGIITIGDRRFATHIIGEPEEGFVTSSFGTFFLIIDKWCWIVDPAITLEIFETHQAAQQALQSIIT